MRRCRYTSPCALLESHLKAVLRDLAYPGLRRPKLKPLQIRIHRDRAEYMKKTGDLGNVSTGMAVSPTKIITFQRAVLGILKHEITHLVIHAYLPMMPLWIHEGVASGGYRQSSSPRTYTTALSCQERKQFMSLVPSPVWALPDELADRLLGEKAA